MAFEIVRLSHAESQTQWVHQSVTHPISFCPYKVGNFLSLSLRDRIQNENSRTDGWIINPFFLHCLVLSDECFAFYARIRNINCSRNA